MVINILGTISQWERETISERTSEALQYKRLNGRVYNHSPYGYDRSGSNLIPNGVEQKVIKLIHSLRASGKPFQAIASHLNNNRVPTKKGSHKWHKMAVKRIYDRALKN